MSALPVPREVFFSYAEADETLCLEMERHLSVLKREGLITTWHKGLVDAGRDKSLDIDRHLSTASMILLLLSANFVASDACYTTEMSRALARHEARETTVVPVLLRPIDGWQNTPIGHLAALPSNGLPVTEWADTHAAWASVTRGIRSVLQDGKRPSARPPSPAFPSIWNIPYPRNPFFTGRNELLSRLSTALKTGQATALSQAISGLGGIGKTQMAVEYAYQHCDEYQAVLWTLSDTRESLVTGYIAIAELLGLPERNTEAQQIIIQAVKTWFQVHHSWLLILDNADDLALVREFIPSVFGGHLLLTTRAQSMGRMASSIEVDTMDLDTGALFLLRRVGLVPQTASLDTALSADKALAREICEELGGLPLALDQAGAFIEEVQCSLLDFQLRYRRRQALLLGRRGGIVADHPEPVATTWSLSFEKVEQRSPEASELLRLCAVLNQDAIPIELITKGARHLGPTIANVSKDDVALDEAIATLGAYSLIRRSRETKTLSIHRLVQAVLKDTMDKQTRRVWAERAVLAVNEVFPEVSFTTWPLCERYLSQALSCAIWIEQEGLQLPEAANVLQKAGWYLTERASYREARPLLERAYQISQKVCGPTHLGTARDAATLANLYDIQGKYQEAEPLYRRALSIQEQELGTDHPATAASLNMLGLLSKTQGKYAEAESLYKRALGIREQRLGRDHPDTAQSLNNLATLYATQGKYSLAEELYKQALTIRERTLGGDHPSTAISLGTLAQLYMDQSKYRDAEPLLRRAFTLFEQQLGTLHPHTATCQSDLARLYLAQGKYTDAEPLYVRALSVREQKLGGDHPLTATSLNNLALLYDNQGKYSLAEKLYKQALTIRERKLGSDHPDTAQCLNNLAGLYRVQGKYRDAEQLYRRVLEICEQRLGGDHPDTAIRLNNLAGFYSERGRSKEAEALFKRVLTIRERALGGAHPLTQSTQRRYVLHLRKLGCDEEADSLERRALDEAD